MHVKDFGTNFELAETVTMQEIESYLMPELQNSQYRLVARRDKINLYCKGGFFKAHRVGPPVSPPTTSLRMTLTNLFASHLTLKAHSLHRGLSDMSFTHTSISMCRIPQKQLT